jgi:NADH-quinone oxidoreductase subunit J
LGASGTYLLLPHARGTHKPKNVHALGAALAGLALLMFALFLKPVSPLFFSGLFFYVFAITAIAGGLLTVTSRDPVHSALWFASVVLSTSGLFLLAGAQFLAAGTVIVYAGAIIVTFLFVIMLAQMEGRATYDRAARMPFRASWTCFMLFFAILWSLLHVHSPAVTPSAVKIDARLPRVRELASQAKPRSAAAVGRLVARADRPTARINDANGLPKPHVAGLGETLFTDHLVTVELAGSLLFVALIGAVAIASPKSPVRPGVNSRATPTTA